MSLERPSLKTEKREEPEKIEKKLDVHEPGESFESATTSVELAWMLEVRASAGDMPADVDADLLKQNIEDLKSGKRPEFIALRGEEGSILNRKIGSVWEKKTALEKEYAEPVLHRIGSDPDVEIPIHTLHGKGEKIILSPGSFTGPKNVEAFAVGLAAHHENMVVVPEHGLSKNTNPDDVRTGTTRLMQAYGASIEVGIKAADSTGNEKMSLVGFSSGAAAIVEAALRNPEKVRSVVLLNPIGVALKDSPYLMRMFSAVKGSLEHGAMLQERKLLEDPRYAKFADWVPRQRIRGFGELAELLHMTAKVNLTPLLEELTRKGIRVTVLATEDDKLFSLEDMEREVGPDSTQNGIELLVLKGEHTKIGEDPEVMASFVADILSGKMK